MRSVYIAVLSLLAAILYSRGNVLYIFYANAPGRLQRIQNWQNVDIKFQDVLRNCEDVVLDTDHEFALLSCDPGRDTWNTVMGTFLDPQTPPETGLYLWNYADSSVASQPVKLNLLDFNGALQHFHPLGIDYHATSNTIFVVNHAPAGSCIETFKLNPSERTATHKGTIKHTLLPAPNSVTAVSENELFVTNDHYFLQKDGRLFPAIETLSGMPGGSVAYVDLHSILQPKVSTLTRVSFANGIVKLNSTSLAVASSNMNSVYIYAISSDGRGESPQLEHTKTIATPFHPDNLSVDQMGMLIIAGHPHLPTLDKVHRDGPLCRAEGADREGCEKGLSWIAEWNERDGLKHLYAGVRKDDFGTSTTAVRDIRKNIGIVTGLYERGILIWNED